jgi:hypothetical protein
MQPLRAGRQLAGGPKPQARWAPGRPARRLNRGIGLLRHSPSWQAPTRRAIRLQPLAAITPAPPPRLAKSSPRRPFSRRPTPSPRFGCHPPRISRYPGTTHYELGGGAISVRALAWSAAVLLAILAYPLTCYVGARLGVAECVRSCASRGLRMSSYTPENPAVAFSEAECICLVEADQDPR